MVIAPSAETVGSSEKFVYKYEITDIRGFDPGRRQAGKELSIDLAENMVLNGVVIVR